MTGRERLEALLGPVTAGAILDAVREELTAELAATPVDLKRWMTVPETADYLGTTTRAVYARIDRRRIPPRAVKRSGRSLLVDRHVLDRTLEA